MGSPRVGHTWVTKPPFGGTRDQVANIHWNIEKARNSRKTSTSALLTMLKPLTWWITTNCGKFLKRWEYQTILLASWETCMQVKKQQSESDIGQQTGPTLGKEYVKAVYHHPAYLTYMQSTSWEMLGWMKPKLDQDYREKYQPQICKWHHLNGRKPRGIKEPPHEGWASLVALVVKNLPAMQETWIWSLGWEDPLARGKATHSSILAWRIPWTV